MSYRKIRDLCQYFNLEQLITELTNFTETSSSTIDLFLTSNKNNIILSGVGEPFLSQIVRYHSPIYYVFSFDKIKTHVYTRKDYLYDRANYQEISHDLQETDWKCIKMYKKSQMKYVNLGK